MKVTDEEIMKMLRDGYVVVLRRSGIEVSLELDTYGSTVRQLGSLACSEWELVRCVKN